MLIAVGRGTATNDTAVAARRLIAAAEQIGLLAPLPALRDALAGD